MYKNILSNEELAELLAPREDLDQPSSKHMHRLNEETGIQETIVMQYLYDTVQLLLREVSELRERILVLEGAHPVNLVAGREESFAGQAAAVAQAGPAAQPPEKEAGASLSRTERYRSKRSKWF